MPKRKHRRSEQGISDIEGIIIPIRWDEDGNPTAVALATSQEEEFPIDMGSKKGKKLLGCLQQKVRIHGAITISNNDQKMLTIRKCLPIAYDEFVLHGTNENMSI